MQQPTQQRSGAHWILSLLSSAGLGLLIFVSFLRMREVEPPLPPMAAPQLNWAADFPALIKQVTDALGHLPLPLPSPGEEPQGAGALRWTHRRYELTLPRPEQLGAVERLLEPIRAIAPGVTLHVTEGPTRGEVQIGVDGLLTHTLVLHWLGRRPRLAIVVDQLGDDLRLARALTQIEAPLAFAVLPSHPFSKEVAELAALFRREVLLDLPQDASGGDPQAAQQALNQDLTSVPHISGVSGEPHDREPARSVFTLLKQKDMFFIDRGGAPTGAACEVAKDLGLPCAHCDIVASDSDDERTVRGELETVIQLAQTRGDIVVCAHARPVVVAALQAVAPTFAAAGVDLTPVSQIARGQLSPR